MHHWNESAGAQLALSYQLSWENPAKQAASWPHDRVKVIRLKKKKKVLHNNSIRKMEQSEANSIHFFQWEKHADGCTLYQVKLGNTSLGSQVLSSMSLLPEDAHHTDHTGNHC